MSSSSVRKPSISSLPESSPVKKPAASVRETLRGDFVSIQSRAVLDDKLEEIANVANEAIAADGIAIALREGDQFLCRSSLGFAPEPGVEVEPGQGVCGQCLAESRLVLSQDLPGEVKSALAAPVVVDGEVQGLIAAFSFRAGAFAASHSDLLCCLASDIAQGLKSPETIHLVSRDRHETGTQHDLDDDPLPRSLDQHLSILQAVTTTILPAAPLPQTQALTEPESLGSADTGRELFSFRLPGFLAGEDESSQSSSAAWQRPFRNRADVLVIVAAIIIAMLTFGLWLHHRRSQPYVGELSPAPPATSTLQPQNYLIPSGRTA